ncbi:Na+/H+ antiporter [Chitinophaga arvensicola]|uniref:Monovalent cation:H+ antiporter, CPA1 family n=1 Tax=Chitinophaga arvensicola TaxID=29529 RepID=A0A1I0S717_9BACT|nr:Na+/H+ antiporter [Chitinophaga arvensicola]SEW51233.1 monovalent cation:H+ antiporter, CPA1 family [Chitinophaga arvensicola]
MENYSIVIFIMALMILLSAVADKIRLPYPVLLITAGIGIGFIPALPNIELNPEVVFLLFLPPLLYDAAFNISPEEFRTNFNTIGTLAIGLVFLTAAAIAVVAHYLIPGMTWPLAFVLGAILSATDAVAAMSITKGLGLSHKTITILEGESLINDASALVTYHFAIMAVTGTAFVFWKASFEFIVLMAGGIFLGALMAKMLGVLLRMLRKNDMVVISLMLLMPFVTYLLAEEIHVSGVIAVVVLGLRMGRLSGQVFPEKLKQQSGAIWDIIIFLLNGLIFILIGLQFPYVIKNIPSNLIWPYIGYGFLITLVALLLRMGRVFSQQLNLDQAFKKGKGRITENALLDFKNSLIISWSGMRGIVSLAIAIGLPMTVESDSRNAIIFISVVVVLITLIGQGISLPWIVKAVKLPPADKKAQH